MWNSNFFKYSIGSLILTIAPSTLFNASNTRVSKNLKAAPWDKTLILFNSSWDNFFIDGYTSVRKLSDEELNNIKVLSQGAALRFLLTRVFDALNKVEGAIVKIKDPMEYLKRLEFHKNAKNHEDYFF